MDTQQNIIKVVMTFLKNQKTWKMVKWCLSAYNAQQLNRRVKVKWRNPGKGVAPFPTAIGKGSFRIALDCDRKLTYLKNQKYKITPYLFTSFHWFRIALHRVLYNNLLFVIGILRVIASSENDDNICKTNSY